MASQFSTAVEFDLVKFFSLIGTHPSQQSEIVGDEYFATCVTSRNWKPFVIGILAPDNPIDFVPVRRIMQEIKKAEQPPLLPQPKPKKTVKGGKGGSSYAVEKKYTAMNRDAFRQTVIAVYTRMNGGMPPSEELLSLLCAHAWTEMGATVGYTQKDGTYKKVPNISTLNNNIGGIHKGPGSKKDTAPIPGTGNNVLWTDSNQQKHEFDAKTGKPIDPNDTTFAIPHKGEMVIADPTKPENKGFYASVNGGYVAVDTQAGSPYLVAFRSHDTMEGGIESWISLLVNKYPGIKNAATTTEYTAALLDGKGGAQYYDETIGPPHKNKKGQTVGNGHYDRSLQLQQKSYQNEYPENSMAGGPTRSTDATDDPSQKLMAYGSSFDLDDPLSSVYGRNIEADDARLKVIQSQMDALRMKLAVLRGVPPLILLINPQEFRRSHENFVDFGTKTRVGNIVHTYLEQPIKINASGVSPAQFAVYADMSGGLTNYNRVQSLSYRNLMSLVMIYKNNGALYDVPSGKSDDGPIGSVAGDGSIILPGSIFIYYDDHVYIGSFDSLSLTDDASKPHNMAYSFTFTVRYDIHVDLGVDVELSSVMRR